MVNRTRWIDASLPAGILALFALALPAEAQLLGDGEIWIHDRPDSHAPASIDGDQLLVPGEIQVSYRMFWTKLEGTRVGTDTLRAERVLDFFPAAPLNLSRYGHVLDLAVGISESLTVSGRLPFFQKNRMEVLTEDGFVWEIESGGLGDEDRYSLGDPTLSALWGFYDNGPYRGHVSGGVSLPLGSIQQRDVTPATAPGDIRLPYPMQIGSGTVDLRPGITFLAMNDRASTGIQAEGVFRLGMNDLDYSLGDRVSGKVWGAFPFTDYVSASIGLYAEHQGNVNGQDEGLDFEESPLARPDFQGGTRVQLPIGMNVYWPEGRLAGHRFRVEAIYPIHQDLDGIQLEDSWSIQASWRTMF